MSENQRMQRSIKVKLATTAVNDENFHPDVDLIEVHDGHLYVKNGRSQETAAIYAPGKWVSAIVQP